MVLLDTVTQVELFLNVFVTVYVLVIFVYVLTSWIQLPYSLRGVQRFLYDVCEPYLRLWRRILPMAAVIGLIAADRIGVWILERLH